MPNRVSVHQFNGFRMGDGPVIIRKQENYGFASGRLVWTMPPHQHGHKLGLNEKRHSANSSDCVFLLS